MAEIGAFAAIRYNPKRSGVDLSSLLAPPYDVLSAADKQSLLARSDRNIVAIDLPHVPPKDAGPASLYSQAAATLNAWLADGVLVREARPALYVYHQVFDHGGRRFTRRMFVARLRLVPFNKGVVLPHEQTFGGPKADRLALMRATRCNLSPIFGLYADPADVVGNAFAETVSRPADAVGTLDGVESRLWVVDDPHTIETVCADLADTKVYIADGHHRYGTAMLYRDELAAVADGPLAPSHPANFAMLVLASMDDPGCLILPYHRVLVAGPASSPVTAERLIAAWSGGVSQVAEGGPDLELFDGATGQSCGLIFADRARMNTLAPEHSAAWRQLDTAYLHRFLLDELLPANWDGPLPVLRYAHSTEEARALARSEAGVALLLRPTPMPQLRAVSETGDLMPQKSTYFYPKLATGLTINPLY